MLPARAVERCDPGAEPPAAGTLSPMGDRPEPYWRTRLVVFTEPVTPEEWADYADEHAWLDRNRPRTRADCRDGIRPCPFVGCKWHLGLELARNGHDLVLPRDREPWELDETCALDVAERACDADEEPPLAALGATLGLRKQRVDQILAALERRLVARFVAAGMKETG